MSRLSLAWLITAVWAATALHVGIVYGEVGVAVSAAVGLVGALGVAARLWDADQGPQREGRHRPGVER